MTTTDQQFTLSSTDMAEGGPLGGAQYNRRAGGANESPELSWSGFPAETQSFTLTVFDPDAAGPGFWHWAVVNLPASVTSLPADAGTAGGRLAGGAITLSNDAGQRAFFGAGPPAGTGAHRYEFTVYAVDVPELGVDAGSPPGELGRALRGHTLARASLEATAVHGGASAGR